MKKALVSVLVLASVLTSGLTVLAGPSDANKEVYNGVENTISDFMGNDHKTVIVTRTHDIDGIDITDECVYVDQSMSAYSTALELMFNNELEPGYYQVKMGTVGDESNTETVYFIIGDFKVDPKDKLDVADARVAYGTDEGKTWYKQSFTKTVSNDEFSSYKSIKLISEDGTRCIGAISFEDYLDSLNTHGYKWNRTKVTGSGDITIGLQIYAIPEGQDDFSLYFSTEEVKDAE